MKKKKLHIHFICTGNAYRSRLAEAYLKSKRIPGVIVSSSGTEADKNLNGVISWYAQRIIYKHNLVEFASAYWTQTTSELLDTADIIIFMQDQHLEQSRKDFGYTGNKHRIWNIPDLSDLGLIHTPANPAEEYRTIQATEQTFQTITGQIHDLIAEITGAEKPTASKKTPGRKRARS